MAARPELDVAELDMLNQIDTTHRNPEDRVAEARLRLPDRAEACEALWAILDVKMTELEGVRRTLWNEFDGPDLSEVIDLKFFCGFSFAEIAAMRGVSERTIQRHWEKGRLYLHQALASAPASATSVHATHQP